MKNLPLLSVTLAAVCAAASGQAAASAQAAASGQSTAENPLATSRVFSYDEMKVRVSSNGTEGRMVFNGTLATGEAVGAHESTQPAGTAPPALHKIHHSELIVLEEGTVEFHHDGKVERAGPGSILYVAYGTDHFVKNVGDGPAKYVVIQIGGDTKK